MPTNREQLKLSKPKFDCRCIDAESLANLRLSLITAKDTYNDVASKLIGMELQPCTNSQSCSPEVKNIQEQARKFDVLLHELDKIPQC